MMVMAQWMVVMMIPMKSSVMTMTMAMISPLREGISPAGSPCQRALSLSVVSIPWRRRNISWTYPPCLGFREADIREEATWGVDPGGHAIAGRGPQASRAQVWRGAHLAHLAASFWLPPASDIIRPPELVS